MEDDEENNEGEEIRNLWDLEASLGGRHAARAAISSILDREAVEELTENDPRARELILEILERAGVRMGGGSGSGDGNGENDRDEDEHEHEQ